MNHELINTLSLLSCHETLILWDAIKIPCIRSLKDSNLCHTKKIRPHVIQSKKSHKIHAKKQKKNIFPLSSATLIISLYRFSKKLLVTLFLVKFLMEKRSENKILRLNHQYEYWKNKIIRKRNTSFFLSIYEIRAIKT